MKTDYWQVVRINNRLIRITVQSLGSVDKLELSMTLKSDKKFTNKDIVLAREIVTSIFNLDFNSEIFMMIWKKMDHVKTN